MTKIVQDVRAFRRRMLIGAADLWVIDEGKNHDRAFYDKILRAAPSSKDLKVRIRLSEQLSIKGVTAGGKLHSQKLHQFLKGRGELVQHNGVSAKVAVFMIDRDNDDFAVSPAADPHLIRTRRADVEAEILMHCKLMRAVATSHGLAERDIKRLKRAAADPPLSLASLWEDWIRLRLIAIECGLEGMFSIGAPSLVNVSRYGPPDTALISSFENKMKSRVSAAVFDAADRKARQWIADAFSRGEAEALLKGKWLSNFLAHLVGVHLSGVIVKTGIGPDHIVIAGLASLKPSGALLGHYESRLARALS